MNLHHAFLLPTIALLSSSAFLAIGAAPVSSARGPEATFTRPDSPAKPPDPDGFLHRWLLLDPIRVQVRSNEQLTESPVQAAVKKDYFPNQFTVVPKDGDKVTVDGAELAWHAVDAIGYNVGLFHFASEQKEPTLNVIFWAVTLVNCPEETPKIGTEWKIQADPSQATGLRYSPR